MVGITTEKHYITCNRDIISMALVACSLRAQLMEARCLIAKLSSENERLLHERRPGGYHLDKRLEDLRQLQVRILSEMTESVI